MNAAQIQAQLNSNYYFNLVSFTLLFYDYFLTLEWEISRYWSSAFTWPNILFFANRYGTLLGNIPVVIEYFSSTNGTPEKVTSRCRHLESYHQYFIIATQALVAALLILRTYALYDRNKLVLAFMLSVAVGAFIVGIWSVITAKAGDDGTILRLYFGCNYAISHSQGITLAAAWAGVAVLDCMIFLLTLYRTCTRRRPSSGDLFTVLLRDGSVYFGVMVVSNLSNILTFVLSSPFTRGIATTFTNIISSIILSRLMFNLRDPALSHISRRPELDTEATMDIEISAAESSLESVWQV
ncbi:hypothetical protein C8R44DRAFT_166641 [Mycena epipterygia]|nr:hypothetical protein C8R44DRAFT_166641 [Mycena epipterygia]